MRYEFLSDNAVGIIPEALESIHKINHGHMTPYKRSEYSKSLDPFLSEVFEKPLHSYLSLTGTFANNAAIKALLPNGGILYASENSHYVLYEQECAAFINPKVRHHTLPDYKGKISPEDFEKAIQENKDQKNQALTLTQITEKGTVYNYDELKAICDIAKRHNIKVHIDGVRLSHACVSLGLSYAELLRDIDIHILTFGLTKQGFMAPEMVLVFDETLCKETENILIQCGHNPSKIRFFYTQVFEFFKNPKVHEYIKHSHRMAKKIEQQFLKVPSAKILYPVDANMIFVQISSTHKDLIIQKKWGINHEQLEGKENIIRLVASFDTTEDSISKFFNDIHTTS